MQASQLSDDGETAQLRVVTVQTDKQAETTTSEAVCVQIGVTSAEDLLCELGPPLRTFWKEDVCSHLCICYVCHTNFITATLEPTSNPLKVRDRASHIVADRRASKRILCQLFLAWSGFPH